MKKVGLLTAGAAAKYQMDGKIDLANNQQIMMNLADILIQAFIAESCLLRVQKIKEKGYPNYDISEAVLKVILHDAQDFISKTSRDALASFATGDEKRIMLMGIQRFSSYPPQNVADLRTKIAQVAIDKNAYGLLD